MLALPCLSSFFSLLEFDLLSTGFVFGASSNGDGLEITLSNTRKLKDVQRFVIQSDCARPRKAFGGLVDNRYMHAVSCEQVGDRCSDKSATHRQNVSG
ncbi:hypothetical protein [Paraburkholderia sp. BL6665CI2N2]|uniref:hypothetical protein n=1 Tax=Paraburkholderia sp. BL6665CI2N2 TaxID=1938806 RepID=UPI001FBA4CDF|nr:hypothetical protein [Paraburkholderia sp. BL6665CI2N2]